MNLPDNCYVDVRDKPTLRVKAIEVFKKVYNSSTVKGIWDPQASVWSANYIELWHRSGVKCYAGGVYSSKSLEEDSVELTEEQLDKFLEEQPETTDNPYEELKSLFVELVKSPLKTDGYLQADPEVYYKMADLFSKAKEASSEARTEPY